MSIQCVDSIESVRTGNTRIQPIHSIVALIDKAPQPPTWRRDYHQSGDTSKNTSSILTMFFWKLLKPANNRRELQQRWRESTSFKVGARKFKDRIDILGFFPTRLPASEISGL